MQKLFRAVDEDEVESNANIWILVFLLNKFVKICSFSTSLFLGWIHHTGI